MDATGNAYVTGCFGDNAFKIAPDADGDGVSNEIDVCPNTLAGMPGRPGRAREPVRRSLKRPPRQY